MGEPENYTTLLPYSYSEARYNGQKESCSRARRFFEKIHLTLTNLDRATTFHFGDNNGQIEFDRVQCTLHKGTVQ